MDRSPLGFAVFVETMHPRRRRPYHKRVTPFFSTAEAASGAGAYMLDNWVHYVARARARNPPRHLVNLRAPV